MIHLHTRTSYSLLNSTIRIPQLVSQSKKLGFNAVACTDINTMHGAMEFNKCCKKEGIKPIFGLETEFDFHGRNCNCLILAKNDDGFKKLLKISSLLNSSQSIVALAQMMSYKNDWIVIVYGEGGLLEEAAIHEDTSQIHQTLIDLQETIGDYYIGLSWQETSFWRLRNQLLKQCAKAIDIKTVALNKIYYLNKEDSEAYRILCGIRLSKTLQDKSLSLVTGRYFLSKEEMMNLYDEEDLHETENIASMCNVTMSFLKTSLPKFNCPNGLSSDNYLTQLCMAGLKKRFKDKSVPAAYVQRLKYELNIILSMQFSDYFLIVWDFIRFSRLNRIYVGPGRGSAAGSLVAWCLGITHIDPLEYGLLFERFLNPDRISMPDIDTDFPDNRRDEVIQYVKNKYGKDHTAHIATFGTLGAKQVLRDVGRVMEVGLNKVDTLCKAVPNRLKITLKEAFDTDNRFRQLVNSDRQYQLLFKQALKLEGLPRHISMHAAGIVMSLLPLSEVVPVIELETDMVATQYTMEHLEELGLIKMDFLGLRNLTIIDEIVQKIKAHHPDFDIMKIPLDDQKTFRCLKEVDTVGIFQLESDGMRSLIRKIQPVCFEDIVVAIALFRPGPMENIPLYLENRLNPEKINYLHADLKKILESTYGIIIYQEQIMQIAQKMAGFSLAKADVLRKAMSKKKEDELIGLQNDFINGSIKKGYHEELARKVYDLILKFANYGFNKSHSVAYGLLAYQLAYLKANAPLEFFEALLTSVIGSESKTSEYIDECRRRNVKILGPSINFSKENYCIENDAIRFPLRAIKGIGEAAAKEIIDERNRGQFTDYFDFIARIGARKISRKVIECLIDSGALDEFNINRKSLHASLDDAVSYGDLVRIETEGQVRIDLGLVSKPVLTVMKDDMLERAAKEKAVLGFYFSSHPILTIKKQKNITTENLAVLKRRIGNINGFALITRTRTHRTKKGDMMMFLSVTDESTEFDIAVMPNQYQRYRTILEKGVYILFEGKKDREDSCILQRCDKIDV